MGSIVIAEKNSQAKLYRDVVGSRYGQVLAASGHLFTLAEPEDVNPAWKNWTVGILRPENGFYPNKLPDDSRIKGLYRAILEAAKTADTIYIATDPDREGEGIGMSIINGLRRDIKWDGKVLRVIQNAQDEKTLKEAFAKAQPIENYRTLYQSFVARQQADQIFNLSLTRSASVLFKPDGWKGALSVGRVFTPTLGIVCRRELAISGFEPEDYFHPWVEVEGAAGRVRLTYAPPEKDRIYDRATAAKLAGSAASYSGPIQARKQRKSQQPPPLFSLAKLQAEAARRFKWSVEKTTEVLQVVYEMNAVTYPRSSETSLPEAEIENAPAMLEGIQRVPGFGVTWAGAGPTIRIKAGAFSDKDLKGAAHTAIVPNLNTASEWAKLYERMGADQRKLFELIARRYLAAIGPDRVYDSTRQWIEVDNHQFAVTGIVEVSAGWREATGPSAQKDEGEEGEDDSSGTLPPFQNGDAVRAVGTGISDKQTTPPPRYTDATLIIAMIEAWRFVDDPEVRAMLKEKDGIGTEATRGGKNGVVANLLKRGLVAREKGGHLTATQAGLEFFGIIEKAAPRLLDVGLTGQMEILLDRIKSGDAKAVGVVNEIVAIAEEAVQSMVAAKAGGASITSSQQRPPSEGMKKAARAKAQREGIKVPAGVLSDMAKCRAFLGPLPERDSNSGPRPPSDSALGFARKIAGEKGVELPEGVLSDAQALSKWIDSHKSKGRPAGASKGAGARGKGPSRPAATGSTEATPKQVELAEKIAARKKVNVPDECFKSKALMSKWLDTNT